SCTSKPGSRSSKGPQLTCKSLMTTILAIANLPNEPPGWLMGLSVLKESDSALPDDYPNPESILGATSPPVPATSVPPQCAHQLHTLRQMWRHGLQRVDSNHLYFRLVMLAYRAALVNERPGLFIPSSAT